MALASHLRCSPLPSLVSLVSLLGLAGSMVARGDEFTGSVVGFLAEANDFQPTELSRRPETTTGAVDGDAEVFRNSRLAVPLLVVDLEPTVGSGVRLMTGRAVGIRPQVRRSVSAPQR